MVDHARRAQISWLCDSAAASALRDVYATLKKNVGGQGLFDILAWVLASFLASFLRFEFQTSRIDFAATALFGLSMAGLSWLIGRIVGLYGSRYRAGSFDEANSLALTAAGTVAVTAPFVLFWGLDWGIPRSTGFIAAPLFVVTSALLRAIRRLRERRIVSFPGQKKAIIFGAGEMAELFVPHLFADSSSEYRPVALIDDDLAKANRRIAGVKMEGGLADLPKLVPRLGADTLIVAIASVDSALLARVRRIALPLGLKVSVLPSLSETIAGGSATLSLRELGIEDLVGRRAVSVDPEGIFGYISGQTVLVTGAGGSIGVELCRQVLNYRPERVVLLDRDESSLQIAQLAINGSGLFSDMDFALADIRDQHAIDEVFRSVKPDVVFHAAALKHLPALQRFPDEAWKTNVVGTANVLSAARTVGVRHFVNISTDKAADPQSVLGHSKKIAEELTAWYSSNADGTFLSVRFGNVLGSRGSLVPTLQHLIDAGKPVTITDANATRFFMTIPEACQLVLQAGSEDLQNAVLVLDMGEPVKIIEIAEKMIELSGKAIPINFSGLRPGEKLHEELASANEKLQATSHPKIWRLISPSIHPSQLVHHRDSFGKSGGIISFERH